MTLKPCFDLYPLNIYLIIVNEPLVFELDILWAKNMTVNKAQQESTEESTHKKKGKLKEFFSSTPDFGKIQYNKELHLKVDFLLLAV